MEEQGLAQQSASMPSVQDVVKMIVQGARPEDLIRAGIPQELVMAAMQMIQQQMQPQDNQSGLANSVMKSNDQMQPMPAR